MIPPTTPSLTSSLSPLSDDALASPQAPAVSEGNTAAFLELLGAQATNTPAHQHAGQSLGTALQAGALPTALGTPVRGKITDNNGKSAAVDGNILPLSQTGPKDSPSPITLAAPRKSPIPTSGAPKMATVHAETGSEPESPAPDSAEFAEPVVIPPMVTIPVPLLTTDPALLEAIRNPHPTPMPKAVTGQVGEMLTQPNAANAPAQIVSDEHQGESKGQSETTPAGQATLARPAAQVEPSHDRSAIVKAVAAPRNLDTGSAPAPAPAFAPTPALAPAPALASRERPVRTDLAGNPSLTERETASANQVPKPDVIPSAPSSPPGKAALESISGLMSARARESTQGLARPPHATALDPSEPAPSSASVRTPTEVPPPIRAEPLAHGLRETAQVPRTPAQALDAAQQIATGALITTRVPNAAASGLEREFVIKVSEQEASALAPRPKMPSELPPETESDTPSPLPNEGRVPAARMSASASPLQAPTLPAHATASTPVESVGTPLSVSPAPATRDDGPQDFATLVNRLHEAREAAGNPIVRTALVHAQFGLVAMQFRPDEAGISVSLASADPDFAASIQAAAAASMTGGNGQPGDTAREHLFGQSQHQTSHQGQSASSGQGEHKGSQAFAQGSAQGSAQSSAQGRDGGDGQPARQSSPSQGERDDPAREALTAHSRPAKPAAPPARGTIYA